MPTIRDIVLISVLCICICDGKPQWLGKEIKNGILRVTYRVGPTGAGGQTGYANIVWAKDAATGQECYWVFVMDVAGGSKTWQHFSGNLPSEKEAKKVQQATKSLSVGDTDPNIE